MTSPGMPPRALDSAAASTRHGKNDHVAPFTRFEIGLVVIVAVLIVSRDWLSDTLRNAWRKS